MKNKIITNSKYLTIWFIIWLSIIWAWTYAWLTWAGTLWSLFEKVWPSNYKLIWTNIKDESITNLQIERNTITEDTIIDDFKARDSDKLDWFDSTNFIKVWDAWDLIADNTIDTSEIENGTILEEDLSQWIKDKLVSKCILFWRTINHWFTITAYSTSSVPYWSTCLKETRVCNNWDLSWNYTFKNCSEASPKKCTLEWKTINHWVSITAYSASSVPSWKECLKQTRTCDNWVLSWNYDFLNCSVASPKSCTFKWETINHWSTITAYSTSTVPHWKNCLRHTRTCNNWVLSINEDFNEWASQNWFKLHSEEASEEWDLILDHDFLNCSVASPKSCTFKWETINHWSTITAYSTSSVPSWKNCSRQTRTCNNWVLSWNYAFQNCSEASPKKCTLEWKTINHWDSITAYFASNVPYWGKCLKHTKTCYNWVLSTNEDFNEWATQNWLDLDSEIAFEKWNFILDNGFLNCSVASPKKCTIGWRTINHWDSIILKEGKLCKSKTRTCKNWVLSWSSLYNINWACNPTHSISCNYSTLWKKYYFNNAKKCTRIDEPKIKNYTHPTVFTGNYGEVPLDNNDLNWPDNVGEFCKKEIKRLGLGRYDGEYHYSRDLTKWAAYGKIVLSHRTKKPMFKGFVRDDWGAPRVTDKVFCYSDLITYEFR